MRLATFALRGGRKGIFRIGVVWGEDSILDLLPAAALYLKEKEKEKKPYDAACELVPFGMIEFLERGKAAMALARKVLKAVPHWGEKNKKVLGLQKEPLLFPVNRVTLQAPVPRPGKIVAMGLNFRDHAEENKVPIPEIPVGFLKASSCVVGPYDPVPYSSSTQEMDYELEMAIVIGKKGKSIPKEKALDHVAGLCIMNDLSARDIQRREMEKRLILLSKSLDGYGPMGPFLVTLDEIPDPHNLKMELWVNQEAEPRQKSSTNQLIYNIPDLVAYWSQMTLEPGDVITSGTPGGVAGFRESPEKFFLKRGDVVEARIEKLGFIRNKIV